MRRASATMVIVLAGMLSACAGGGGVRAPVEERSTRTETAAPAPRPAASPAPTSAPAGGVVVEALPDAPPPRVEALGDGGGTDEAAGTQTDDGTDAPTRLALVAPARGSAAQSLLAAAVKAAGAGEWDRAQAALERAVRLSPQDPELWRQLAYSHYRTGDLEQAAAHAQRAVALAPDDAAGWRLVGDIEAARGNADAAARARARAGAL